MLDDDESNRELRVDELLYAQSQHQAAWQITALRGASVLALASALALLTAGRSWLLHLIGFFLAAIVAAMCASFSARLSATHARPNTRATAIIVYLVTVNGIAIVVAAWHAAYLARRYI